MHYRELAANQRGFLLRSQLTEEEIKEARETGFIINEHLLYTKQGFETQLSGSSTSDTYSGHKSKSDVLVVVFVVWVLVLGWLGCFT